MRARDTSGTMDVFTYSSSACSHVLSPMIMPKKEDNKMNLLSGEDQVSQPLEWNQASTSHQLLVTARKKTERSDTNPTSHSMFVVSRGSASLPLDASSAQLTTTNMLAATAHLKRLRQKALPFQCTDQMCSPAWKGVSTVRIAYTAHDTCQ